MEVEETIVVELVGDRGITRDIITKYGESTLDITVFSVTDARGNDVPFSESRNRSNGDINLAIGGNTRLWEDATYVIRYTIYNAMVGTDTYQELYFNTNGTQWPNGVKDFSAQHILD